MEGGSLFNSGFLGAHFNWWIGQIVDDSTWRDNTSASKFEDTSKVAGWGRRYKVRIIGLHDKEEESVPSDQLPWAQIMYPVTAGGGQAGAHQTANLRQGNFVFGFFLDGADQQVPVIMGVLGNNAQTKLETKIGTTKQNFGPTSGFSQTVSGNIDPNLKVPDNAVSTTGSPNTTLENSENPQQQSKADVVRQEIYDKKIVFMNPCDMVGSALKAIQTLLEELVKNINKILSAAQCYLDALTNLIRNIQDLISNFACKIAKYIKIIFDKIMEYILKMINKAMAPTVQSLPPNKRNLYLIIKEKIIEIINCIFNKIIDNLCGQIDNYLNQQLNTQNLPSSNTVQAVLPCSVEQLTGSIIYTNISDINSGVQKSVNIINAFLADILSDLSVVGGAISNAGSFVNGITGSITSALSFENISLNVFGCDIRPKCPISDFYNLQEGGGGVPIPGTPRFSEVDANANKEQQKSSSESQPPFATPLSTDPGTFYGSSIGL